MTAILILLLSVSIISAQITEDSPEEQTSEDNTSTLGSVIPKTARLYAEPAETSRVVKTLAQNSFVEILDDSNAEWLKVSYDELEGWIKSDQVERSIDKNIDLVMKELSKTLEPTLQVNNRTNQQINFKIAGIIHKIPAGKQKVITLKPGSYKYTVTTYGFTPGYGTYTLESGMAYVVDWKITTQRVNAGTRKKRTRRN